jgi:N-acetylmuramoyl-L-alanine amidase
MISIGIFIIACSIGLENPDYNVLTKLQPLDGYRICVDPGHGGQDSFSCCYTGGTWGACTRQSESDVNLQVGFYLSSYLKSMGAQIIMTRLDDVRISENCQKGGELSVRAEIANRNNCDLLISIHHNYSVKPNVNYGLFFYNSNGGEASHSLAKWVSLFVAKESDIPNYGAVLGNFSVLTKSNMPSILTEASFLSNPTQDINFTKCCVDENGQPRYTYIEQEAWGIAKGVALYALSRKNIKINPFFIKSDKFIKNGEYHSIKAVQYKRTKRIFRGD